MFLKTLYPLSVIPEIVGGAPFFSLQLSYPFQEVFRSIRSDYAVYGQGMCGAQRCIYVLISSACQFEILPRFHAFAQPVFSPERLSPDRCVCTFVVLMNACYDFCGVNNGYILRAYFPEEPAIIVFPADGKRRDLTQRSFWKYKIVDPAVPVRLRLIANSPPQAFFPVGIAVINNIFLVQIPSFPRKQERLVPFNCLRYRRHEIIHKDNIGVDVPKQVVLRYLFCFFKEEIQKRRAMSVVFYVGHV